MRPGKAPMTRRQTASLVAAPVLLVAAFANAQVPAQVEAPTEQAKAPAPPPQVVSPTQVVSPNMSVGGFQATIYGFAKLDTIVDDTQSLNEVPGNMRIYRPFPGLGCSPQGCGTTHGRTMLTARDSRFGFKVAAPEWEGMRASAQIKADFGGIPSGGNVAQA